MSDAREFHEMPEYVCHKHVHALKIAFIDFDSNLDQGTGLLVRSALFTPDNKDYVAFRVDGAYLRKHEPKAGGYYVVYEDGYKSYSPAAVFEAGYTLV